MGIIRLSYELAYLEARLASKMRLSPKEWSRLSTLRQLLARDPAYGRRAHRRFKIKATGTVQVSDLPISVDVEDICAGGCAVVSPVLLRPNTQLKISIEMRRTTFVFNAVVRRFVVEDGKVTLGLSFSGIPLELRRFRTRPPSMLDELLSQAS